MLKLEEYVAVVASLHLFVLIVFSGWQSLGGLTARHASGARHLRGPQVKGALGYCTSVCSQGKVLRIPH
jgi:hypothetical protein